MGKRNEECHLEFDKTLNHFDYYINNYDEDCLKWTNRQLGSFTNTIYSPLGLIMKFIPFNFPIWTGIKFLIPNIINGNSVLLWFSENCLLISEIIENLIKNNEQLSQRCEVLYNDWLNTKEILETNLIKGVSFTGSL